MQPFKITQGWDTSQVHKSTGFGFDSSGIKSVIKHVYKLIDYYL